MKDKLIPASLLALSLALAGCNGSGDDDTVATPATPTTTTPGTAAPVANKNVVFFLGDGMGITTMTAARIYQVGEDGELTMDQLPETAFVHTYSNDGQVTDSAPSMAPAVGK